ncbi:hypothetical protein [Couchioplanes azureus]|uniref:hypothetical protein n=1 Tax=Couchioplanes caeruleus TaxID=56438 RepID=UPI0016700455|nr:hypothetical protein [Couchioplanes caeruleus]
MTRVRVAMAMLILVSLVPGMPAAAAPPLCAWPQEVGAQASNVALPDSNARYWVMPFEVYKDRRITVTGAFPDTRYASFTVYDGFQGVFTSNGVSSARADHEITPDPGSVNPWQQPAVAGGAYTLQIRMDVAPDQVNALPLAPAGTPGGALGFLVYRIYLPTGGTSSPVVLPTLTVTDGGRTRTLPPCPRTVAGTAPDGPAAPPRSASDLAFARTTGNDELFPNPDSGYLSTWVTPPGPETVVVVRGRAAASPDQPHPHPWPQRGDDMRYWSLCTNLRFPYFPVVVNHLPGGETDPGCRHDDVAAVDAGGDYTFVIGTEQQRNRIEAVRRVTFVPFSAAEPRSRHLVLLRNMMPAPGFHRSVLDVPPDGRPGTAAAVMGDYYPRAHLCPLSILDTCAFEAGRRSTPRPS